MAAWTPPWRPGLPKRHCSTCGLLVIAASLDAVGDCAQCVHDVRWDWKRQQLTLNTKEQAA